MQGLGESASFRASRVTAKGAGPSQSSSAEPITTATLRAYREAAHFRLATWNVWHRNDDLNQCLATIRDFDADLIALQEVPPPLLDGLARLPTYSVHVAEDFIERGARAHLVILSRLAVLDHETIRLNHDHRVSASLLGRLAGWVESIEAQALELHIGDQRLGLINLHLPCAVPPARRMTLLRECLEGLTLPPAAIICGDFNSMGHPVFNGLAGWALGMTPLDWLGDEKDRLDGTLSEAGFSRCPYDGASFPRYGMQLDHIATRQLVLRESEVRLDRAGSDHRPVVANLTMKPVFRRPLAS